MQYPDAIGSSPVQRLMNRRSRTILPTAVSLLQPRSINREQKRGKMKEKLAKKPEFYNRNAHNFPALEEDVVKIQPFKLGPNEWKKELLSVDLARGHMKLKLQVLFTDKQGISQENIWSIRYYSYWFAFACPGGVITTTSYKCWTSFHSTTITACARVTCIHYGQIISKNKGYQYQSDYRLEPDVVTLLNHHHIWRTTHTT